MNFARPPFYDRSARKKTMSLTINSDLTEKIKAAGINASQVAEEALATRLEQVTRETIAAAARADIEAHNAYVAEHGLFADILREHERDDDPDIDPN